MPLLAVEGLSAGYREVTVLRDVSLEVRPGEVVTVLGSNGAGKSTTLLAISGLAERHAGKVTFDGRDLARVPPERITRAGLAHVPEDRSLFTRLTVMENLRLGAHGNLTDLPRVFELFPALERLRDRVVTGLSGGEQQMLALGRALVVRPRLLLVDELSLGLAPVVVRMLLDTLRRIADDEGTGVLLVEQHVHLAADVADRFVVLSRGRVTMTGSAGDLAGRTAELSAAYLGGVAS